MCEREAHASMIQKLHLIINSHNCERYIRLKVMYCQNGEENKYLNISTVKTKKKCSLAFFLLLHS